MEFLRKLLIILDADMTEPSTFGWFHLMWIGIMILITVLLCRYCKEGTEKQTNAILLTFAIVSILLETYKQINYTFTATDTGITADFQWYAFPWQFCCVPMYIALVAGFLRKGPFKDALCAFLATYSPFAGICVFAYPEQVFIDTIGINIETMVIHGGMIVVGIWLLYTNYVKSVHKTILKATPVFCGVLAIAIILNEIAYYTGFTGGESFNMFYISSHEASTLPLFSLVQPLVPFAVGLFIYIGIFMLAAYVMLLISMGIKALTQKLKKT